MSTKALHPAGFTRFDPKVGKKPVAHATKALEPSPRLQALEATDMPWLSKEGKAALADAPEQSGPPTYKKPARWR
jgi:hypothetical protein